MPRPLHAIIHPAAITHNLHIIRRHAPHSRVWAVVKADAYGHGIRRIYSAVAGDAQTRGTDGFAMLDLDEAVLVRELGWTGPLLLLEGFFEPGDLQVLDHYRIGFTVHCEAQLRMLEAARLTQALDVHLKMNTGMNRLGFSPNAYHAAWQRLRALPHVGSITLMTHFSDADGPRGVAHQIAAFDKGAEGLPGPRSLSNSAATLWHPQAHHDWVRPGIILYGASPSGTAAAIAATGLQPAMTLASELIGIQDLQAGDAVGYGSRFVAEQPMRIGIVACGYADGYPRHAPDGTPVVVNGVRTRLVGRVSMDMLKVDLTPCPQADVGTPVELWGHQLAIDDVAQACGTIGYELMCALARRVTVSVAQQTPSTATAAVA